MNQISRFLIMWMTILSLVLTGCTGMDPTLLVVKPEAVSRVDKLLAQMTDNGTFDGSVLIAQVGWSFSLRGMAR